MRALLTGGVALLLLVGAACGSGSKNTSRVRETNSLGPSIGTIKSIVVDPHNQRIVYAVDDGFPTLIKSTDAGASWRVALQSGSQSPVGYSQSFYHSLLASALAFDPRAPRTIYAGATFARAYRLIKSTDGGRSWRNAGLKGQEVEALAISPNSRIIYAGTSALTGLLFKSTNGGATWQTTGLANTEVPQLALDPRNAETVYAGAGFDGGVFKSTNGGESWRLIGLRDDDVEALAINPAKSQTVYAGTLNGLFKSTDAGRTWRSAGPGGKEVWAVAIAPSGRVVYAGGNDGMVFTLRFG